MTREELALRAVGLGGSLVVRALGATVRYEVQGAEHLHGIRSGGGNLIFAFWHSRLLPLVHIHRGEGVVALVSEHRDGEYIARVMHRCGLRTARGSSTRGGSRGLRSLLAAARGGRDLAIVPDGPKGPARIVKEGPLVLARLTGFPIVPTAVGGERVWRLRSWDRFLVPKPFARLRVRYGPPIRVPRDATEDELVELRDEVQEAIDRVTDEADAVGAAAGGADGASRG